MYSSSKGLRRNYCQYLERIDNNNHSAGYREVICHIPIKFIYIVRNDLPWKMADPSPYGTCVEHRLCKQEDQKWLAMWRELSLDEYNIWYVLES